MSHTEDNLKKAFAGEAEANRKYLAFAKKAEGEGYKQIAKLFRATAEAETVHAMSYLHTLGAIKSTEENLKEAILGEIQEATEMYPSMITHAREDGATQAQTGFRWANQVEAEHAELYKEALNKLKELPVVDYYVCQVCGYTGSKAAPDFCPICNAPKEKFTEVK